MRGRKRNHMYNCESAGISELQSGHKSVILRIIAARGCKCVSNCVQGRVSKCKFTRR